MADGDSPLRYTPSPTDFTDWKRHASPVAALTVPPDSPPSKCYKINNHYVALLLGLLDYYVHFDAFVGTEYQQRQSAAWIEDLRYILMTGNIACYGDFAMRIRQNGIDVCVLDVSYDGGESWEVGFDFGLCFRANAGMSGVQAAQIVAEASSFANAQVTIYGDDLANIAPDMIHDASPKDTYRDLAICLWIHDLVQAIAAAAVAYEESGGSLIDKVNVWLTKANIFLLDVVIWLEDNLSPLPDIMGTLLWDVLRNWQEQKLEMLQASEYAAFKDAGVLQAIHCYAYDRVEGATVTEAIFRGMFDGVSSLESVTADMETWLVDAIDTKPTYVVAMSLLEPLPDQLESGAIVYACPCGEWEAEILLELVENVDPWEAGGNAGGVWADTYWQHKDYKIDPASSYWTRGISLKAEFPLCNITRIQVTDYTLLAFASTTSQLWLGESIHDPLYSHNHDATGYHIGHTTPEISVYASRVNWWANCDRQLSLGGLNGQVSLYGFKLFGRGYNPFA